MRHHKGLVYGTALGAVLLATTSTTTAFGQPTDDVEQSITTTPAPRPPSIEGVGGDETKDTLLGTGLFLLAVSYLPAVSVAASSNLQVDQHLYVPIAGPWIDLSQRPTCSPPVNCAAEQTNRALLETSGILQGVGAFLTLVGLLTTSDDPPHHPAPKELNEAKLTSPKVQFAPTQFGAAGYGLAAFGKF
jgi:hypothetical protein